MDKLDFKTAFMYPFNRAMGLLNILWVFVPIIGWFALGGYKVRIVQSFTRGEFKELPTFNFKENLGLGFFMFLKSIPFFIAMISVFLIFGLLSNLIGLPEVLSSLMIMLFSVLVVPMLVINFLVKETVASYFEFDVLSPVFNNIGDYLFSFLKDIVLAIVFIFMIIILVGIPAGNFTKNIFMADFYRRNIKNKSDEVKL